MIIPRILLATVYFIFGITAQGSHAMEAKESYSNGKSCKRIHPQNLMDTEINNRYNTNPSKKSRIENLYSASYNRKNSQAIEQFTCFKKENIELSSSPLFNFFEALHADLIITVASFLGGNDFQRFAFTCHGIRNTLMNYSPFFMPIEENGLIQKIGSSNISELNQLIFIFSRSPKQTVIPRLLNLSSKFSSHEIELYISFENSQIKIFNLKNYIKCQRILAGLGFHQSIDLLVELKDSKIRTFLSNMHDYCNDYDKNSIIFISKQALIANYKIKKSLSQDRLSNILNTIGINIDKEIMESDMGDIWIPYEAEIDNQI